MMTLAKKIINPKENKIFAKKYYFQKLVDLISFKEKEMKKKLSWQSKCDQNNKKKLK